MSGTPDQPDVDELPRFEGHILHIVAAETSARWAPMLRQVLQMQHDSGARVTLLTEDRELLRSVEHAGYELLHFAQVGGLRAWRLMFALPRLFPIPPEITHVWGTASLRWVERWTRPRKLPLVIHAFGERDLHVLRRRHVHACERVLVSSSTLCQQVLQRDPGTLERWHHLPPAAALPFNAVEEPGLGERTLTLLCASHLGPPHGLDLLVEAVAQLVHKQHDVQAVIVGDGKGASAVWQRIREHKINEHCVVIDEPWLWEKGLPGADVCVVPAQERDLWLAPLLAMGLGHLVIASRDQTAEWFVEDHTFWQFTPGSAVELAYLLSRATENPKAVQATQALAADYFYSHHTVGAFIQHLLDVYRRLRAEVQPPRKAESRP